MSATQPEGTGETGTIAEDVEGGEEEVADAAADTAEEVEKALPEEGVETVGGEGAASTGMSAGEAEADHKGEKEEETEEDDKMDVGTPAAAAVEAEEEAPVSATEEAEPEPPQSRPSRLFGLYFVGNKYNPNNYWCVREQMPCRPGPDRSSLTSGTVSRAGLAGGARRTSSTMPRARSRGRRRSTSTTTSRVCRVACSLVPTS